MAKKTVEKFYSDLSGDEIDTPSPTVAFTFDGVGYEVDLTEAERQAFADAVAPYVAVGRRAGRASGRSSSRRSSSSSASSVDAKAVREWAQEQGLDVPARGRVPSSLIEAYQSAH
ncbi:MAG: Lsr2 family protein [Propionibacteriales bacterium]|nr:Lsr2 family protein [Propionibacteriales bacterium]